MFRARRSGEGEADPAPATPTKSILFKIGLCRLCLHNGRMLPIVNFMSQPTFETLVENGKQVTRYGLMREVDYLERFRFWSADEFPANLWRPCYYGHVALESTVAVVVIRAHHLTGHRLQSAIVNIGPALHDYANSIDAEERTHAGSVVVRSAIRSYLHGELTTSDEARREFAQSVRDTERTEHLRQRAISALTFGERSESPPEF